MYNNIKEIALGGGESGSLCLWPISGRIFRCLRQAAFVCRAMVPSRKQARSASVRLRWQLPLAGHFLPGACLYMRVMAVAGLSSIYSPASASEFANVLATSTLLAPRRTPSKFAALNSPEAVNRRSGVSSVEARQNYLIIFLSIQIFHL